MQLSPDYDLGHNGVQKSVHSCLRALYSPLLPDKLSDFLIQLLRLGIQIPVPSGFNLLSAIVVADQQIGRCQTFLVLRHIKTVIFLQLLK